MDTPIFNDPTGRRARRVRTLTAVFAVLTACWPATIVAGVGNLKLPTLPNSSIARAHVDRSAPIVIHGSGHHSVLDRDHA